MNKKEFQLELSQSIEIKWVNQLIKKLPWPYSGMINDLWQSIRARSNYLALLGLACYIEVCGRNICFNGNYKVNGEKCFLKFLEKMGVQKELLEKKLIFLGRSTSLYNFLRNGLAHNYFMKTDQSEVAMFGRQDRAIICESENAVTVAVVPLFKLFCNILKKEIGRSVNPTLNFNEVQSVEWRNTK